RQVGHLISRVICISLFYQNSTCFFLAYFLIHHLVIDIDGSEQEIKWGAHESCLDDLVSIDIFDSEEANYYLTKESIATYMPPAVTLFAELAKVCSRVKDILQTEQDTLLSKLPKLPSQFYSTEIAIKLNTLNEKTNDKFLESFTLWSENDQQQLNNLNLRLSTDNPTELAKQRRNTALQVKEIIKTLEEAQHSLSSSNIDLIRLLKQDVLQKRQVALDAAKNLVGELAGVSGDTWRAMWSAARKYSQVVYPEQKFPVTDDAKCLLCHQELNFEAKERLQNFEKFVCSTLEQDAENAEKNYRTILTQLPLVLTDQQIRTQCEAAGIGTDDWLKCLGGIWLKIKNNILVLNAHEEQGVLSDISEAQKVIVVLNEYTDRLNREANQFDQDATEFDRVLANKQKLELEAKLWTSQQVESIKQEVLRLRNHKQYELWKSLTNPRNISIKAASISERAITEAYIRRFNDELRLLGAHHLKVELIKSRTARGEVFHKIQLKGTTNENLLPELVLSEGERRIISLAAFLADVVNKPYLAPFIFDDPISSLDHDYEWHVASRLADLAKQRQVIIFTHRLSLFGTMEDVSKKNGEQWHKVHFSAICIEGFNGSVGHPAHQQTWNSNTKTANNILLTRLKDASSLGQQSGVEVYRQLAQAICSDFRKLLEKSVEDDLLNAIVRRHRRSITTDNKIHSLALIEKDDCLFIEQLMTKYSCFEHSQSTEIPIRIPEENELRSDIESLKKWREELSAKRKSAS
ncbi:AAA family ATPase, partial [Acinetobacter ursingii]|uniref:AAA family ATPase n=1 Tax=Acinetobacter ursingii TaxID=108980 RepID=UPI003AF6BD0C